MSILCVHRTGPAVWKISKGYPIPQKQSPVYFVSNMFDNQLKTGYFDGIRLSWTISSTIINDDTSVKLQRLDKWAKNNILFNEMKLNKFNEFNENRSWNAFFLLPTSTCSSVSWWQEVHFVTTTKYLFFHPDPTLNRWGGPQMDALFDFSIQTWLTY